MGSNHTFKTKELTTDDSNFAVKPVELPSHFRSLGERAIKKYDETLSPALVGIKKALVCVNDAVLRTAYAIDLKNPLEATDPRVQDEYEAVNDPVFKLKHAA